MKAIEISNLTVRFGGLLAVDDFSFEVRKGDIHSLIGPNGAGKTTVINTITGLYPVSGGSIRVAGKEVLGSSPPAISRAGVARTFQNTEIFGEMSVFENVLVGSHCRHEYGLTAAMFRTPKYWRVERSMREKARDLLDIVGLSADSDKIASSLSFGKQRALEIARALASEPKLLLLDEPAAGLRSGEISHLNEALLNLRKQHELTILLVDHVMKVVMSISDEITVLNFGRKIAEGKPDVVRMDKEVRRAYLGDNPDRA
ncbi:MAG: ABC transporter ATP-binding protein [Pseudorhodoplanes sp.]|uniref:ABC transporter ATP-binding protein n=1 Tax=Pseudorhodoplanes sp. TaxID=1934341 RepID=UPI003D0B1426